MTCRACGDQLPPQARPRNPRIWCSETCRVWAHRNPGRLRIRESCSVCGGALGHKAKRYCSEVCRNDASREWHARRRAELAGAPVTGVTYLRAIAERDDHRCGICGDEVDMSIAWPARMAATLDHVVPHSRGGAHGPENVQLAHWACNEAKGDGEPAPPASECTRCGSEISRKAGNALYCSKRCQKAASKVRERASAKLRATAA